MPKFNVTVQMTRNISVWAEDEQHAEEKAVDVVLGWNGILDANATEVEEE